MKKHLQAIRLAFSRKLVRHLAARLGESENAVGKALEGMMPVVLCQLVIQTGEGEGRELFAPIVKIDWAASKGIRTVTEVLALVGGSPGQNEALAVGDTLLKRLFGARRPGLENLLSVYSGLRPNSAVALLQLVATVLAVGLAQYAVQHRLTAVRLSEEVSAVKKWIYGWLPVDLPRWPGFRRRTAVNAPHAVWAAELARPYWVSVLAVAVVLALLVLSANG